MPPLCKPQQAGQVISSHCHLLKIHPSEDEPLGGDGGVCGPHHFIANQRKMSARGSR